MSDYFSKRSNTMYVKPNVAYYNKYDVLKEEILN